MRFLLLIVMCVYTVEGYGKSCKYWCRTNDYRYYCCPSGKSDGWMEEVWHSLLIPWLWMVEGPHLSIPFHSPWPEVYAKKPKPKKRCPPLRAHCPRSYDWHQASPTFCHLDEDCDEWKKCCYDACLEHKTCKHAE